MGFSAVAAVATDVAVEEVATAVVADAVLSDVAITAAIGEATAGTIAAADATSIASAAAWNAGAYTAGAAATGAAASQWIPGLSNATTASMGVQGASGVMNYMGAQDMQGAQQQAAATQAQSAKDAQKIQVDMYNANVTREQPWVTAGRDALTQMQNGMNPTGYVNNGVTGNGSLMPQQYTPLTTANLPNDPGYQYLLQQSTQAKDLGAANKGSVQSGAQQLALQSNAAGLAAQQYNTAFDQNVTNNKVENNNRQAQWSNLNNTSVTGQAAAGGQVNAGTTYANNASNLTTGAGNAAAASTIEQAKTAAAGNSSLASALAGAGLYGAKNYNEKDAANNTSSLANWFGSSSGVGGQTPDFSSAAVNQNYDLSNYF